MLHLKLNSEWIDRLLPDGFPFPSSTLISGPGGSGKPLIANFFAVAWLKNGGSVTFLLINSDKAYELKMLSLFGIRAQDYIGQLFFIDFNPEIVSIQETSGDSLSANLLKPDIWDKAVLIARRRLDTRGPGSLLFGAALNLLLFSDTYREAVIDKLATSLQNDNCIFSVSTTVYKETILMLENAADNLMFARSEKPMKLFMRIERMKNAAFLKEEVEVPLSEQELQGLRAEAETARKHLIPIISKI